MRWAICKPVQLAQKNRLIGGFFLKGISAHPVGAGLLANAVCHPKHL
jgi:hypothetical protein